MVTSRADLESQGAGVQIHKKNNQTFSFVVVFWSSSYFTEGVHRAA